MGEEWKTQPRARISWAGGDPASFAELSEQCRRAGFELAPAGGMANADLGLIDLRAKPLTAKKAHRIAALLRRKSPESPVFFLTGPDAGPAARAALRRLGEIIPAERDVDHALERFRHMIRLRNIAEEAGERLKSLALLNRLAGFPVIAAPDDRGRFLIAGAPGADALAAVNSLSRNAEECVCVLSPGQAMRALDHGAFDGVIVLSKGDNDPMVSFARALRRHPRHAGLCVIHVANGVSELPGLVRQGARDFILRAHLVNDLSPKAQLAIRRARLLRAMQRFLRACDGEGVHDEASGAFSSTFLSEHGARLCARADQTGRSFALSLICLFPDGAPGAAFGRVALHEAARLIRRVIRAEDLVARIGPEKFVALHPATGLRDAEMAARRICGVLAHASYKSDDGANVLAAGVQTTVLSRAPEASIEESVAALLRASNSGNARKVSGV